MGKALPLTVMLLMLVGSASGCLGGEEAPAGDPLPSFSALTEHGTNVTNADYAGAPWIIVFSAEWCSTPCHTSMHAINRTLKGPEVLVVSTDPADEPQGVNLTKWHETADKHDDEDGDTKQSLPFTFCKGAELSSAVGVTGPGTIFFIDSNGHIIGKHEGVLSDEAVITSYWTAVGGSVPE